jgi:hypothetical protein
MQIWDGDGGRREGKTPIAAEAGFAEVFARLKQLAEESAWT